MVILTVVLVLLFNLPQPVQARYAPQDLNPVMSDTFTEQIEVLTWDEYIDYIGMADESLKNGVTFNNVTYANFDSLLHGRVNTYNYTGTAYQTISASVLTNFR